MVVWLSQKISVRFETFLDKTLLDSQLYLGLLILGKVLVTSSQSIFNVQKDRL